MKTPFKGIIEKSRGMNKRLAIPMCAKEDIEIIDKAAQLGIIHPVFIGGNEPVSMKAGYDYINTGSKEGAASKALELLRSNRADILMQGGIEVNSFMNAILDSKTGLKSSFHSSHACVLFLPGRKTPVIITDTFIHEHPSLIEKQMIIESAIRLWQAIGFKKPRIAALAVLEYVNPRIHSTVDSAVLSKMSERGQFKDALVEGPLDIDCAISKTAAKRKGVKNPVAGNADIYLVHDAESGYLFAEHLVFIGRLTCSGVLLGLANPVILNMPFFTSEGRMASLAIAALVAENGIINE